VAYRDGQRWVRTFEPARLEVGAGCARRLRERGVYLITGGCGGIGLTLAEELARTVRARLVLTGRSTFPARNEWERWLLSHDLQDELSIKIRRIQAMEQLGSDVLVLQADVTNPAQMVDAIRTAQERFGALHGVIHAAGILRNESVQLKTVEAAESVLMPKVHGTLALQMALQGLKLDWLVLCSSLTSTVGAIQTVDYSAANAFLDAFAHSAAARGTFVVSINWDNWQNVGMAAEADVSPEMRQWHEQELKKGILPNEGVEAFNRILQRRLNQVLVSTQDLRSRIERANALAASTASATLAQQLQPAHPRPALANPYVAPRNELEQSVVSICQAVLGIEQVGIHDNFFELGCDSLIAIQFIAQLKQEFGIQISPVTLFESPTISALMPHLKPHDNNTPAEENGARIAIDESSTRAATRVELAQRRRLARQRS
jgi:NAD(P)-dependent dehydrogenase (short-subunit alcohol dehydrogenase family)/acyl carrier protein